MLKELQDKLAELSGQATAKRSEIKSGMADADVKRIEGEHAELLKQIEDMKTKIAAEEKRQPPLDAPTPPATAPATVSPSPPHAVAGATDLAASINATAREISVALGAERTRIATITELGEKYSQPKLAREHANKETSIQEFRSLLLDALATSSERTGPKGPTSVQTDDTNTHKRGEAMMLSILHRFDPVRYQKDFDANPVSREFRGLTLIEMARNSLEEDGVPTRGLSKMDIADIVLKPKPDRRIDAMQRAGLMTTSDFPNILANVANKTLREGYAAIPQTFRPLVRVTTVPDFKPVKRIQLGDAPKLEKVNEHGEFHRGVMGEAAETYSISTYGKIVGITRQVLVNDDLGAFTRIPRAFGAQAANLESDLVWAQILANPIMADGNALFSTAHANKSASAAAISVTTVGAGRLAMSIQTGVDGVTLVATDPIYMVVPKAMQTVAEQFRGQLYPTAATGVTPDSMRTLGIISEPRLDAGVTINGVTYAGSSTIWYMAGDVNQIDIIELAYLEGQQGLFTETRMGFDVDGMEVKVRLDIGAKVIDWRNLYENAA